MKFSKLLKHVSSLALVAVLVLSFAIPSFAQSASTNTATTVNLMADASTRYSLGERQADGTYPDGTLLRMFEDEYGITVNVTYDSSGNLANQMVADLTHSADVFISGDLMRMDYVVTAGNIDWGTVYNLLSNRLALVANPSTGLTSGSLSYADVPAWLAGNSGRTIAIGDSAVEPTGTYTKQVFDAMYDPEDPESAGVTWNSVLAHASLYSNVTNVLTAVVDGTNPIGSVYATDAKIQSSLIVLDSKDVNIIYPIGITTAAMNDEDRESASQALVDFLKADIAKPAYIGGSVFKDFGFSAAQ